jgi:myo-inositol-1-phosphate synthase
MFASSFEVASNSVTQEENTLTTKYVYHSTSVSLDSNGTAIVTPTSDEYSFKTDQRVPKVGVMIVGWGGNNGTTLTTGILANKLKLQWQTRTGVKKANYVGSLTQSATTYLGDSSDHKPIYAPFKSLLPMVDPNELVIGGCDISHMNLYKATLRAHGHEPNLVS